MNIKESIINRLRETSRENIEIPLLDKDSLAISALLHDFCNCRCMRHIKGHGRRSAMMLKELGFHLSQEEFLAIRFHMSIKDKKNHPLYEDALHCHLRHIVHKADGYSAKRNSGSYIEWNKYHLHPKGSK